MIKDNKQRILFIYRILLSVLLLASAACFIGGAIYIYSSTDRNPYTYESIAHTFGYIAVPVFLTLLATVVGAVLHIAFPTAPDTLRAKRDKRLTLASLRARLDISKLDEVTAAPLKREPFLRRALFAVNMALYAVAFVISLVYTFLPASFTGDYNASVVAMVYVLIASFLLPLGLHVARVFIDDASINHELKAAKLGLLEMKEKGIASVSEDSGCKLLEAIKKNEGKINLYTKIGVSALAIAFIVVGICGGGMADVLSKAIKICTECIGLG